MIAELRRELHESNLAVSEARSLLSANKRQEKEMRDRLDKLQRALDNGAVLRANNIQMAHGAEQELQVLRSQYETLQRQYKVNSRSGGRMGSLSMCRVMAVGCRIWSWVWMAHRTE